MVWVKSEYAGELAVLATWLTALLPWSVSFLRRQIAGQTVTVVNIRFVLFQFHYLFGISFGEQSLDRMVQFVYEVPPFVPANQHFEAQLWLAAAGLFAVVLLASFVYYADESLVEDRSPVDPVRLFGAAFGALALAFSAATALFFPHQTTVPVGVLFMWAFSILLLRVERT